MDLRSSFTSKLSINSSRLSSRHNSKHSSKHSNRLIRILNRLHRRPTPTRRTNLKYLPSDREPRNNKAPNHNAQDTRHREQAHSLAPTHHVM